MSCSPGERGVDSPEHRFGPITVLGASHMDHHHEQESEDINNAVAPATADALATVVAPDPPFAVVCTVWLSMIPALGWRVRPEASCRSPRSVSCLRSQTPREEGYVPDVHR